VRHPGPLTAVGLLNANLGVTLGLGVLVAIPTIVVAGPLFGKLAGRWVVVPALHTFDTDRFADGAELCRERTNREGPEDWRFLGAFGVFSWRD
jgi:GntP family gluconate:H+ symporter